VKRLLAPVKGYISIAMEPSARRTGRPLSFDRDAALDVAMRLFWQHGYEATSISALTGGMGITPPSLYAAFGDKRRLFREAIDRYLGGAAAVTRSIAGAASARNAAHDLLVAAARGDTGEDTPPGCLLASSLVCCSPNAADMREELAVIRRGIEAALCARIGRDVSEGVLPADSDAEMMAGHVFAVVQGMSTLAKDGAGRNKLLRIAHGALAGWPGAPRVTVSQEL
jgi:AcrR family transcriptional regulator